MSEELFEDLNTLVEQIANERGYNERCKEKRYRRYGTSAESISVNKYNNSNHVGIVWNNSNCTISMGIELSGNDAFLIDCAISGIEAEKEIEAIADFNELYLRIARLVQRRC